MKARRRRNIHVKVGVMHDMKAPQEIALVQPAMPPVERVIHQHQRGDKACRLGQGQEVEQAEFSLLNKLRND